MGDIRDVARRIGSFATEMKDQGIHVGMRVGTEVRCVTCAELWPCRESGSDG